jgi:O-antigen/teichoic acid export membrane protein
MKTNTNLILQHILWRGLYFFSVLLLNIGIARFFAAERSGQIFFIVNNLALLLLFASISLESGSAHYIASEKLNGAQMAHFCAVWALVASGVALVIWYGVLQFTHAAYLKNPGFLLASFLFILGVLFTTYFTALFYGLKQFATPNKILFAVNLALVLILLLAGNNTSFREHFIGIYFASFFVQGILLMLFYFARYSPGSSSFFPSQSTLKKVIGYSLLALTANGIYFLVNRMDYWFVQHFCSGSDLGNYIQASKLAQLLLVLPSILGSTLFPIFSAEVNKNKDLQVVTAARMMLWINMGCCLCLLCLGWFLFPLLFGGSFLNMYRLFVWLIPGVLCSTLTYPVAAWFSAKKRIDINIKSAVLALTIICLGDWLLLPRAGVLIAPVISSLGYLTYFVFTIAVYRKENEIRWRDLLLIRKSDLLHVRRAIRSKIQGPLLPQSPIQNQMP